MTKEIHTMTVQMLLEQSRIFYFLRWNKSNIKEIKATLRYACQITISLKIINKLKFFGVPGNFPHWMGDLPTHKKEQTKTFSLISRWNSNFEGKSRVIEKMLVPALRFVYSHSYNSYVKIVSTSNRQTKLD